MLAEKSRLLLPGRMAWHEMRCMCAQLIQLEIRNANCYAFCCCDQFFVKKWKMKMMNCAWKWLHHIKRVIRKIITIRLIANSFQSCNCSRISFDKKPSRSQYFLLLLLSLFYPRRCINFHCDFSIYFDARTSFCLYWWIFPPFLYHVSVLAIHFHYLFIYFRLLYSLCQWSRLVNCFVFLRIHKICKINADVLRIANKQTWLQNMLFGFQKHS